MCEACVKDAEFYIFNGFQKIHPDPAKPGYTLAGQRINRKIASILKSVSITLTDQELEALGDKAYQTYWGTVGEFRVYNDVAEFYRTTVFTACMSGSDSFKMTWLTDSDNVQVLDYRIDGTPTARALIWKTRCGETVVDRIYPNSGRHVTTIRRWAHKRGYLTRVSTSLPEGLVRLTDGTDAKRGTFAIDMPPRDCEFPYLDTFCYGKETREGWRLYNNPASGDVTFNETDGGNSDGAGGTPCGNCGDTIRDGEEIHENGDNYCESCHSELFSYCESCNCTVSSDDIMYCEHTNEYVCDDCYGDTHRQCESCCDDCHVDTMTTTVDGEVCASCLEDYTYTDCEDEYIQSSDVICVNGYTFNRDNARRVLANWQSIGLAHRTIVCRHTVLIHADDLTCLPGTHGVNPAPGNRYSVRMDQESLEYAIG